MLNVGKNGDVMSDKCAICLRTMLKENLHVCRLLPCFHFLHQQCSGRIFEENHPKCPICRQDIEDSEEVEHRNYRKYLPKDRQRIVECADRGGDWRGLAASLNVKFKTAYGWVRSGEISGKTRGGYKAKYLSYEQMAVVLNKVEEDPEMTLKQLKQFILEQFQVNIAISTVGNYLDCQLYTIKKFHHRPITMNTPVNKQARKNYVL